MIIYLTVSVQLILLNELPLLSLLLYVIAVCACARMAKVKIVLHTKTLVQMAYTYTNMRTITNVTFVFEQNWNLFAQKWIDVFLFCNSNLWKFHLTIVLRKFFDDCWYFQCTWPYTHAMPWHTDNKTAFH